uniref:Uncharacterized protein n=1 Tax=Avena sativa TaxID=4498 RepID=A0ACD5U9N8_AVESA
MAPHAAVLLSLLALVFAAPLAVRAADTHLHFFLHDQVSGSNPTAVQIIKGPATSSSAFPGVDFGDTTVIDDPLTESPSATSAAVGRAQGYYMLSSQSGAVLMMCVNLLLTTGDYNGSTLAVVGRDDIMADTRELSVVGGTGKFRMATGYVLWRTNSSSGPDVTAELDVYVADGTTTIAADAPVSPIDGGGGGSAGTGGGASGKSSSGAAALRRALPYGWANAVVAAVLVALAGCVW